MRNPSLIENSFLGKYSGAAEFDNSCGKRPVNRAVLVAPCCAIDHVGMIAEVGDVRFFVGEGGSPPPSLGHAVCVFTFGDAN